MSSDHAVVAPSKSAAASQKKPEPSRGLWQRQPLWLIFLTVMIANYVVTHLFFPASSSITVPYTFFKQQVQAGNVENVSSTGDSIRGTFKTEVTYPPQSSTASPQLPKPAKGASSTQFVTQRPVFADQDLERRLDETGVVVTAVDENASSWFTLFVGFGPTLVLVGAFVWLSRRAAAASGMGLFGLGKSRAKRYSDAQPTVTFDDVAGIDEAENELIEIADFLKNPSKYQRLGGMMPKGVLLIGAPGTGKTLLARAIAGQAGVPFFSLERLRIHRDDRGHRRLPGAGSVQTGARSRAGDHLRRRTGRHRPYPRHRCTIGRTR